jgi:hydrogenase expression/formation protein HypE
MSRASDDAERAMRRSGAVSTAAGEYLSSGPRFAEGEVIERIESFRRRRPRLLDEHVTLAHGAGGKASAALVDAVFIEAFRNPLLESLGDGAVLTLPSGERLAMSTDSFVVQPRRFPGGSIGELAVHGTCNDLAMVGAVPSWISAAFVLEEGFPIAELKEIVADMAAAAAKADVQIVTGDTKVVAKGAADGLFVTTAGVGVIPTGRRLAAQAVRAGDKVLFSGTMGDHGMAVMLARGDLAIEADIHSDTATVSPLVELLMSAAPSTRWLRDATRGGVGTVCNELAQACGLGVLLEEERLPVRPMVSGACELLGIDPLYVANEGKFVAVVAPEEAGAGLAALRSHPLGADAAEVGEIVAEPAESVVLRTGFGGTRIVDMLVGDPLPRIC